MVFAKSLARLLASSLSLKSREPKSRVRVSDPISRVLTSEEEEDERGSGGLEHTWQRRRADCTAHAVQAIVRARGSSLLSLSSPLNTYPYTFSPSCVHKFFNYVVIGRIWVDVASVSSFSAEMLYVRFMYSLGAYLYAYVWVILGESWIFLMWGVYEL